MTTESGVVASFLLGDRILFLVLNISGIFGTGWIKRI